LPSKALQAYKLFISGMDAPMDLRALRYFVQVADSRSFSKAAVLMRIGQPALSRSVMQLEQDLGVTLLKRSHAGVELTRPGQLLLRRAKDLLDQVGRIGQEIQAEGDELAGTVTLGVPAAVGQLIVPPLLRHLAVHHPRIRLSIVEGVSSENYNRLITQALHLCLLYDPLPHRDLILLPLAAEDIYLVGLTEMLHPLGRSCRLEALENLPMVLPSIPNSRRLLVEKAFIEKKLVLNVVAEVDSFAVTQALLSEGFGYSLTTLSSIADLNRSSSLSYLSLVPNWMNWVIYVARHGSTSGSQVVEAVAAALQVVAAGLMSADRWKGSRPYRPAE
jgi:LysR family transcriptional regulator, nitrogen assimilation regulatory protein